MTDQHREINQGHDVGIIQTSLISVVIPAYNPSEMIHEAIRSVFAQTHPRLEVIVVDDGSTPPLTGLSQRYDGQVTCLRKENGGPASARNAGVRVARGELIAFLDADDVWEPEKIQRQVAAWRRQPQAGLVYCPRVKVDQHGLPLEGVRTPPEHPSGRIYRQLLNSNFIPTSSVVVHKRCFQQVGTFDENRRMIEDYDLWLRIAEQYSVVCVPTPMVRYRTHAAGISRNVAYAYDGERMVIDEAQRRAKAKGTTLFSPRQLAERYAQIHFDCGMDYFASQELAQARDQFLQGLQLVSWRPSIYGYLVATCLGKRVVAALRRAKLAMHRRRFVRGHVGRPTRLMHVLFSLETGGAEHLVLAMAGQITSDRYDMQVCSLSGRGPLAERFEALGVRVHVLNKRPGVDLMLPFKLAILFLKSGVQIVHTHNVTPWLYAGIAAVFTGKRLHHTEHSNLMRHQAWLMRAERWLAHWTRTVIADSDKVRDHLIHVEGLPERKVWTVLNGIDLDRFGSGTDRAQARSAIGLNGGNPVIGTVGRLVAVKDQATLIRAFADVLKNFPQAILIIVGEGVLRGELESLAASLGVAGHVRLLGERDDVPELFQALDLFVLCSVSEGLPLTLLEAMASGKPSIATRVGGIPEVVEEGKTGYLVPPGRPEVLSDRIQQVLRSGAMASEVGRAARKRVEAEFSLKRMTTDYENLYENFGHYQHIS